MSYTMSFFLAYILNINLTDELILTEGQY